MMYIPSGLGFITSTTFNEQQRLELFEQIGFRKTNGTKALNFDVCSEKQLFVMYISTESQLLPNTYPLFVGNPITESNKEYPFLLKNWLRIMKGKNKDIWIYLVPRLITVVVDSEG